MGGSRPSHFFNKIAFFSTLDRPWPAKAPRPDFQRNSDHCCIIVYNLLFFFREFASIIVCVTPLLMLDWLHNCTDGDEAPNQNGSEIDEAPTWKS